MKYPDMIEDAPEIVHQIARLVGDWHLDPKQATVNAAWDGGYATAFVRPFVPGQAVVESVGKAFDCLPKPPEVRP
jgi:hypothetical protein